jgi:nitrile hydratase subunit beta
MNGAQDLGGMMGFGPIVGESEAAPFHSQWERRAHALMLAASALGEWNLDIVRHARETLHPVDYLSSSYYEIWAKGLEKLLLAKGLATAEELAAGRALTPPRPTRPALAAARTPSMLASGTPYDRPATTPARFAIGEEVRARTIHPTGHTRLPRYVRGRRGRIERVYGVFVFPDANAHGLGENPDWLYAVRFSGVELWGRESDPNLAVSVDAWESYLERDAA